MPKPGPSRLPAGPSDAPEIPPGRPRRRAAPVVTVLVGLVAVVAIVAYLLVPRHDDEAKRTTTTTVAYAEVTRGTLSTQESISGSLGYGTARTIRADLGGVVTWLPASGTTIRRGDPVYRVGNRPVPLFFGQTPLYRRVGTVDQVGPDIRMIADNLGALGYSVGSQPGVGSVVVRTSTPTSTESDSATSGQDDASRPPASSNTTPTATPTTSPSVTVHVTRTTVHEGDAVLTPTLIAAIKAWQRDLGLPVTGRLVVGSVLVQTRAVRVSSLSAQVGDPASGDLMSVTPTAKVITVDADQGQAASVERGDKVSVTLPDSSIATARVKSVGTALNQQDGSSPGDPPKLTITLVLDQPKLLKKLNSADLQVAFASETHKNVLTVPVGALLALSEGGYAVQPQTGGLMAVDTGIFAKGLVEISGTGITEGLKVVTTS